LHAIGVCAVLCFCSLADQISNGGCDDCGDGNCDNGGAICLSVFKSKLKHESDEKTESEKENENGEEENDEESNSESDSDYGCKERGRYRAFHAIVMVKMTSKCVLACD